MKVSVIVPTFNRASLIAESLDTVAAQTYRPLELIVVDDGSNDDTAHVVNTWMAAHAVPGELDVIYQRQSNRGPSAARNLGLSLASGELIQFLDSDDRLAPERFASLVPLFEEDPELDFVQTGFEGFCAECADKQNMQNKNST